MPGFFAACFPFLYFAHCSFSGLLMTKKESKYRLLIIVNKNQKNLEKSLTPADLFANISFVRARQQRLRRERKNDTERYRSGHNEAVLKTVCPNGHMGSNPILSAKDTSLCCINHIYHIGRYLFGEIPKRPKGLPWKGSRSGEPARGFKSLFLRSKR